MRKKRTAGESKGDEEVGCHQGEAGGRVREAILKTVKYGAKGWRKRLGEAAESAFLAKAIQMGFGVSKPWGDSDRYDFVVDAGGRLWRVQVKSAYRSTKEGGYTVHAFGNLRCRNIRFCNSGVFICVMQRDDIRGTVSGREPVESLQLPTKTFSQFHRFPIWKICRRRCEQI